MYPARGERRGFRSVSLPSFQNRAGDAGPSGACGAASTWTEPSNLWFVLTTALKSDGKGALPLALHGPKPRLRWGGAVRQALVLENQC